VGWLICIKTQYAKASAPAALRHGGRWGLNMFSYMYEAPRGQNREHLPKPMAPPTKTTTAALPTTTHINEDQQQPHYGGRAKSLDTRPSAEAFMNYPAKQVMWLKM
jgi:hypothetical protein